eukprot:jgi/Mesen1/1483/ME000132S00416
MGLYDEVASVGNSDGGSQTFAGVHALFCEAGIQRARLDVWRKKLVQLGGTVEKHLTQQVTHVVAASWSALVNRVGRKRARLLKEAVAVRYGWIEESLVSGARLPVDSWRLSDPALSPAGSPGGSRDNDGSLVLSSSPASVRSRSRTCSRSPTSARHLAGSPGRVPPLSKEMVGEGGGGVDNPAPAGEGVGKDWLSIIHEGAKAGTVRGRAPKEGLQGHTRAAAAEAHALAERQGEIRYIPEGSDGGAHSPRGGGESKAADA